MVSAKTRSHKATIPSITLDASGTKTLGPFPLVGRRLTMRLAWTGTPTGVLALQTSFDGGTTWTTVPGASVEFTSNGQAQPAGGAGSGIYNWQDVPGAEFRILYTATSGTGTLTGSWEQGL